MFADRAELMGTDSGHGAAQGTASEQTAYTDRSDLITPPAAPACRPKPPEPRGAHPGGLPKREPAPSAIPSSGAAAGAGLGRGGGRRLDGGEQRAQGASGRHDHRGPAQARAQGAPDAGLALRAQAARCGSGTPAVGNGATSAGVATAAPPRRSADRLRQRFATYQRGVQLGRQAGDDTGMPWDGVSFEDTTAGGGHQTSAARGGNQTKEQK